MGRGEGSDGAEPLFTVAVAETAVEGTDSRRGCAAAAVVGALLVAVFSVVGLASDDRDPPPPQPLAVDLPQGFLPNTWRGWRWRSLQVPVHAHYAVWASPGIAFVERPWSSTARWWLSLDGSLWIGPQELAFNPLGSVTTTTGRPGALGVFSALNDGSWRLEQLEGVPPAIRIGSVAVSGDVVVAGSTAPWARVDWRVLAGTDSDMPMPALSVDGDEVVVSAPGGGASSTGLRLNGTPVVQPFACSGPMALCACVSAVSAIVRKTSNTRLGGCIMGLSLSSYSSDV